MAELLEDDIGRVKPQYEKPDGAGFEAWKGKNGHGNVRSDNGQIVALGATSDTDTANTVVGRLKKIVAILQTALLAEELTILSSATRTASGASAEFVVGNYKEASFYLNVTAASGTLDVKIETKDPVSGEWFELAKFAQATAVTKERKADKTMDIGSTIRASYTITGEAPSFTFSLGAVVK